MEPESEEMKTSVWIERGVEGPQVGDSGVVDEEGGGDERERRCEAVSRGPMVLVCRWWAKDWNVLLGGGG